jgi:hypothetical protein
MGKFSLVGRAAALLGGVSLAACSSLPGPPPPVRYDAAPGYYGYAQAAYQPPPSYAANPVPGRFPGAWWRQHFDEMAMNGAGLGVGAVGGFMANRALSGAAGGAVVGGAEAAVVPEAGGVGEGVAAGRAVGAVRAGAVAAGAAEAAAEAAEGAEIIEIIEGILLF